MAARWTRKQATEIAQRLQQVDGASPVQARRSKYGNRKVVVDGATFDSEIEYKHWQRLCLQEKAGLIRDLRRQVSFELAPAVDLGGPRKKPALRYVADFTFTQADTGAFVVMDVKGMLTEVYKIKRHLMLSVHGLQILEVGR